MRKAGNTMSKFRLIGCGVVASVLLIIVSSAAANSFQYHYFFGTYPGRPHQERVYFDRSVPDGAFRDRIRNASTPWNNVTSAFSFVQFNDEIQAEYPSDKSLMCRADQPTKFSEPASIISYAYIDGIEGNVAITATCERNGRLNYANIVFDSGNAFYFGRGNAPAKNKQNQPVSDLASIAVHEFGHAAGFFNHLDEGVRSRGVGICAPNDGQHTMCVNYEPGSERWRNLEDHDRHTHADAYNR